MPPNRHNVTAMLRCTKSDFTHRRGCTISGASNGDDVVLLFGRFLPKLGGTKVLPLFLSHALKSLAAVGPHRGRPDQRSAMAINPINVPTGGRASMGNGRDGWLSAGRLTAAKSGYRTLASWRDLAVNGMAVLE